MRSKHQNIGTWKAVRYRHRGEDLLRISAVLPTGTINRPYRLLPIDYLGDEKNGLIYCLEGAEQLDAQSAAETFLCSKEKAEKTFSYSKIVVVGFLPGAQKSFLIALIDILEQPESP